MKPIIGICANYSYDEEVGILTNLGLPKQEWQLLAADYTKAVEDAGGCPVILPVVNALDSIWPMVEKLDGIIFTGGSDIDPKYYNEAPQKGLGDIVPDRDRHEINLCRRILAETEIPVLGICRGIQLINVSLGGTLYQDLAHDWKGHHHALSNYPKHSPSHKVHLHDNSWLAVLAGVTELHTNSFHHQAVKDLGKGLKTVIKAEDGMVEGVEMEGGRFVAAVQWHPEMMCPSDLDSVRLFKNFVEIAKKFNELHQK